MQKIFSFRAGISSFIHEIISHPYSTQIQLKLSSRT